MKKGSLGPSLKLSLPPPDESSLSKFLTQSGTFMDGDLLVNRDGVRIVSHSDVAPVGNFIHYLSTFLAGLVVGFVSAWKLALLSIAVIPGIAFVGGLYAYTLTGLTSKGRESYANAGIIAEQAIAQVRTVYSYVGECKALNSYSDAIQNTLKLGYKEVCQNTPCIRDTNHLFHELPLLKDKLEEYINNMSVAGSWSQNAIQATNSRTRKAREEAIKWCLL